MRKAIVWNNFSNPPHSPYRNVPLVSGDRPTQEELKKVFSYDKDTGELRWKFRPRDTFAGPMYMRQFEKRFAGKSAVTIHQGFPIVTLAGKVYRAKNLVWLYHNGELPQGQVICIDGDKLNTRIENLTIQLNNN